MRKIFLLLGIIWMFAGCGDDYTEYTAEDFSSEEVPTITIAEVKKFYDRTGVTTFIYEYTVKGVVTANDKSGNFYRSFIIEDETGALEIKAGTYDLHTLYPLGREVFLKLQGATCGKYEYEGMYQIGLKAPAYSGYEVDYFSHDRIVEKYVVRGGMSDGFEAPSVAIEDLTQDMIGNLVKIEGLTLEEGGVVTWGIPAAESYNGLPGTREIAATDMDGNTIYIYTSGYADFASEVTPSGQVDITGIVMRKSNTTYRLKIRDLSDVE